MKIVKPDEVEVLFRLYKPGDRPALALGVLKVFALSEGERSEPLPAVWPMVKQVLGQTVLDVGLPKARGEFLVYGCAHPPAGFERQPLLVEAAVGEVRKQLAVFGDREFGMVAGASSPKPIAHLPISPENAFGGDGFADNPLGKGYAALADGRWPLPNVENPAQLIVHRGDRSTPAGFWALAPDAPAKLRLLGRCDARWQATRWPHLPLDTYPDYFQAAPEDQRFAGLLRGDEKIVLRHLHPRLPLVESALPGLRARCFVERAGSGFGEIAANAETVWLFPETDCGLILFRAQALLDDEDGDDIANVLVELERLSDPPLPQAHYAQCLQQRIAAAKPAKVAAPATAAESVSPGAPQPPPTPPAPPQPPADPALDALMSSPAIAEVEQMTAQVDAQLKALMAQHGLTAADLEKYVAKPAAASPPMSPGEIEKALAEVEAQTQQLMAQHGIDPAVLEKYLAPPAAKPPPGGDELGQLIAQAEQQTQALIARSGMNEAQLKAALAGRPELTEAIDGVLAGPPGVPIDMAALFAQIAALVPAPAAPAAAPAAALDAAAAVAPERLDRAGVIARHAAGQSLAACELAAIDLSGLDLAGADFSGAQLAGASFAGSRLTGAKFADALLQSADFSAAELSGASFAGASADGAKFADSRLRAVDASQADFSGGDFSGADLGQANLRAALFAGAKMSGVKAGGCVAEKASFEDCDLSAASFAQARITGARFNGADLQRADFSGASGEKAEFFKVDARAANFAAASLGASRANASSDFSDADLRGAQLPGGHWSGAVLCRARLGEAVLDGADLSRCRLDGASLLRASAKAARFDKADLDGADLSYVNLFKGSLRLAKLGSARLQMANLYGVNFYGTAPTATSLLGANIDRTPLSMKG